MHRFTLSFILLLAAVLLTVGVTAQEAPSEPVIYEGLAFPELPYPSRWIEVNGSRMHYLEGGDPAGDPILFLHGNPTWSYLWRNIMPYLEDQGRVIAVDMIGFGRSDRLEGAYDYVTHREYLDGFIAAMGLEGVTLVIHDWGSALGLDYASRNPDNVKAIALMEAVIPPVVSVDAIAQPIQDLFLQIRMEGVGEELVINQNFFIDSILAGDAQITDQAVLDAYRVPFMTPETRQPVLDWPRQIPYQGEPAAVVDAVERYSAWLTETETPILLFHVTPGILTPEAGVAWAQENIDNLMTVALGEGGHYIQELYPDAIGQAIAEWYDTLP